MKITKYDNREEWLDGRVGSITGSRLKDIIVKRGTNRKMGYYELIAEQLATPADDENPMDRGNRLEEDAIARFEKETGKTVNTDLVIWEREDNSRIAISPDGSVEDENGVKTEVVVIATMGSAEAVEAKCLSSAKHVKAYLTQQVPSEYEDQRVQYFIVNDELQTLYFAFLDPRMSVHDFFYLVVTRESIADKIEKYLAEQRNTLESVDMEVNRLLNS